MKCNGIRGIPPNGGMIAVRAIASTHAPCRTHPDYALAASGLHFSFATATNKTKTVCVYVKDTLDNVP